jgi:hypothetical protein
MVTDVHLLDGSGAVAGSARSVADGSFAIAAPPGRYTVQVVPLNIAQHCPSVPVTVPAGGWAQVMVSCDSGMR